MKEIILDYYVTVEQLSELFNVHPETIRRWIRSGKLKANQTGKGRLKQISVSDLVDFVDEYIKELEKNLNDCKKFREYLDQRIGA